MSFVSALAGGSSCVKPDLKKAGECYPETFRKSLLGPMTGLFDAFKHDKLEKLELPRALEGGSIIGAFGPAGSSLLDLPDSSELSLIQGGTGNGIFIFMAGAGMASVCYATKYMEVGINGLWDT